MLNAIITIIVGIIIGSLGGKFLKGVLAKIVAIIGLLVTIYGIYLLIVTLLG
ncbi:MAG: hypothetical protein LKF33_06420 [Prevotella sp.]|jgi:hypothetical protein|nr:hypothetical protein [Prevotella sp.]